MGVQMPPDEISGLTSAVVKSYERHCGSICPFPRFLPSKDVVIEVVELLRRLLFPGYFGEPGLEGGEVRYHVASLLIDVRGKLRQQVCRALAHAAADGRAMPCEIRSGCGLPDVCQEPAPAAIAASASPAVPAALMSPTAITSPADPTSSPTVPIRKNEYPTTEEMACADSIVGAFLSKLATLREILLTDVDATFDGDPAARGSHEIIFAYPGIFAITVYRLAHELFLLSVPLIPRIMTEYAHSLTGIDIHPGATVGHHFFIDHGTGIVIGETTTIGNYVKIYQGVTLGALSTRGGQSLRDVKRHPTLEDEVTVYSSATILGGGSVIGRGAVIGANAFITQSVPAGARVSMKLPELAIKGGASQ